MNDEFVIRSCGYLHILLCLGSIAVPFIMDWKNEFRNNSQLIKQMFITYSIYIFGINLFFGIVSIIATNELLNSNILSKSILLFISIYWFGRVCIQFFYFDNSLVRKHFILKIGEWILFVLFLLFAFVYGYYFWKTL